MGPCRGCMIEFSSTENGYNNRKLVEKFKYCTQLEFCADDGLPKEFCEMCTDTIPICYSFIKKARSADLALREIFIVVKSDPVDETVNHVDKINVDVDKDIVEPIIIAEADIKIEDETFQDLGSDKQTQQENNIEDDKNDLKKFELDIDLPDSPIDYEHYKDTELKVTEGEIEHEENIKNILATVPNKRKKGLRHIECQYCFKPFATKLWYEKHLRTVHADNTDTKFKCKLCPKSFSRNDVLKQHMVVHTDERPHACHLCPKRFKMRKQLNLHLRLHTSNTEFACQVCDAKFQTRSVLTTHEKTHFETKSNLCHLCGVGFTLVGNLAVHMRTHTGEKPYACSRCHFRCAMSSSLRRHERLHSGSRPHVCASCDKKFSDKSGLVRHMRTHTGELPYRCNFCSRAFIDSSKRKRHILSQHQLSGELTISSSHHAPSSSTADDADFKLRRQRKMVRLYVQ